MQFKDPGRAIFRLCLSSCMFWPVLAPGGREPSSLDPAGGAGEGLAPGHGQRKRQGSSEHPAEGPAFEARCGSAFEDPVLPLELTAWVTSRSGRARRDEINSNNKIELDQVRANSGGVRAGFLMAPAAGL